jgi:quinol monooxygenase YgiN
MILMKYGLFGKFTAHPGKRDELAQILIQAAELLNNNKDCIHYVISLGDAENEVWVWEAWASQDAHDRSLEPEDVRTLIQKALPLIAGMSDQTGLKILGGKGLI